VVILLAVLSATTLLMRGYLPGRGMREFIGALTGREPKL